MKQQLHPINSPANHSRHLRRSLAILALGLALITAGTLPAKAMKGDDEEYYNSGDNHLHNCRQTDDGTASNPRDGSGWDTDRNASNGYFGTWTQFTMDNQDVVSQISNSTLGYDIERHSWERIWFGYPNPPAGGANPTYSGYGYENIIHQYTSLYNTGFQYNERRQIFDNYRQYELTYNRPGGGSTQATISINGRYTSAEERQRIIDFYNAIGSMRSSLNTMLGRGTGAAALVALALAASQRNNVDIATTMLACAVVVAGIGPAMIADWNNFCNARRQALAAIDWLKQYSDSWSYYSGP